MSVTVDVMRITVNERGSHLRERIRDRLERAAQLRCATHGHSVFAVTIHARENGWFDSTWTTCCEEIEQQAMRILRDRC